MVDDEIREVSSCMSAMDWALPVVLLLVTVLAPALDAIQ